jgi:hypothetical protein
MCFLICLVGCVGVVCRASFSRLVSRMQHTTWAVAQSSVHAKYLFLQCQLAVCFLLSIVGLIYDRWHAIWDSGR